MDTKNTKQRVGRPAKDILFKDVVYNDKEYTVGYVTSNDTTVIFVIDKEDFVKMKDYSWHYISNSYISHTIQIDDKRRELYLHNLIMGRLGFPGKGSKESVDPVSYTHLTLPTKRIV